MTARARTAFTVFVAVEIVGAVIYIVNGRKVWFFGVFGDEWDFLAGRRLTIHDLLLRHGDHLVALPALVFRVLYGVVGLRSYLPYQLLAIGLHLAAAALLRVIMRRAGVGPWIATAAAGLYVLFGSGSQDILIAFQITFTGALVFGLIQLLLADHAGPIDRRDWLALLAGLAALLCSDVAITMVAAVGVACLLRKRWVAAALQTVPLAAAYGAWTVGYGRTAHMSHALGQIARSARATLSATFDALGQVPFVGWALAAMLVVGLVLAARDTAAENRPRLAASLALLIGSVLFALMLAVTRSVLGTEFAASSRYVHILAALLLPSLAIAADAIARRRRVLGPVVLALLVIGVPGNIADVGTNIGPAARYREQRRVITGLPGAPLARAVPHSLHPTPSFAAEVTVGWLLDGARSGRIPVIHDLSPREQSTNTLRLSLEQTPGGSSTSCEPLRRGATRRLAKNEALVVRGSVDVQSAGIGAGPRPQVLRVGTSLLSQVPVHTLRAAAGPLTLHLAPRSRLAALC